MPSKDFTELLVLKLVFVCGLLIGVLVVVAVAVRLDAKNSIELDVDASTFADCTKALAYSDRKPARRFN